MTSAPDDTTPGRPDAGHEIPELEVDENDAPRPEEEIADVARATPDISDHSAI